MSTPTPPQDEPMPDREERELAALYRQLPAHAPDEALDARVLDTARRAARKPRRFRFLLAGLGSAAGLVMAAGITWHLVANGPGGRGPARDRTAPPAALKSRAASPARQVVPVHVLSANKTASGNKDALQLMPAENGASPSAAPPAAPRPSSRKPAAAPQTFALPAPVLIEQARQALEQEDTGRARMLVRQFVQRYPGRKLPNDLAPYAPSQDAGPGAQ